MNLLASFQADHLTARDISQDRQRAQLRVIQLFLDGLPSPGLAATDGDALTTFLTRRAADGVGSNTIRKERAMLLSFFSWAYGPSLDLRGGAAVAARDADADRQLHDLAAPALHAVRPETAR